MKKTVLMAIALLSQLYAQASYKDVQTIDAVVLHPKGNVHFFVDSYFYEYNVKSNKTDNRGKLGRNGWHGLRGDIDAAITHPKNKLGYLFVGNVYYRYDFNKQRVIGGKRIIGVDGWKGLDGPIDAAIVNPKNGSAYFFKGNKYVVFDFNKDKVVKTATIGVNGWKGLPSNLDGAVVHPNGKGYFFKGDHYYRWVFGKGVDKKGIIGRNGWKGLFNQLDATLIDSDEIQYMNRGEVKPIKIGLIDTFEIPIGLFDAQLNIPFPTLRKSLPGPAYKIGYSKYVGAPPRPDAALYFPKNRKYYFFKGSKYYRYDARARKIDKTGRIGSDGWRGVPANIDAAAANKDRVIFFKGSQYYEFTVKENKVVKMGNIANRFKGLPNFIDAAHFHQKYPTSKIVAYKKDIVYTYSPFNSNIDFRKRVSKAIFSE
ncbi:hemopexin repeat-containing protein [Spongiivirga sp. MCCC 1A20706]|uniref:hemopexin repeat-containing protein n=1 Tax=Spongiivirga sp. MCCC 1A20706 TaxID=3160963 RepID=UPI003977D0F2